MLFSYDRDEVPNIISEVETHGQIFKALINNKVLVDKGLMLDMA